MAQRFINHLYKVLNGIGIRVPFKALKGRLWYLNEEIFDGFLDAKTVGNMITYSAGPDNGSTMVGIINEELSFNICLM